MKKLQGLLVTSERKIVVALALMSNLAYIGIAHADLSNITVTSMGDKLFCPIMDTMSLIIFGISVIMVLWAAFLFVTAQDDSDKITRARKTIVYAAVAIVVVLLADGFPSLVASVFGSNAGPACGSLL